ncbi:IclR family transcriptional regulator [Halegenticoccus soli]|uniref:IclR family transcriptional regulator n=1 Tax=Halegenticoccus soli TaxID=1985678 RepID=UPI001E319A88|nr:IclR family transcriptional regulator [Halegenticoccus soli]
MKTTDTAFDIVESLWELETASLGTLAERHGVAKSTVHRHLATLINRGYVVREGDEYRLSLKFLDIGQFTRTREEAYVLAKPKVRELAEKTDERAQFIVEENGRAVYVHMAAGDHAVTTNTYVGKHAPIHASAAGLAILAKMDEATVENVIERHGLPSYTEYTITTRDALYDELEAVRERGYSVNDQGHIRGLRAVGAPVCDRNDEVIGALSISGPTNRMQGEWFDDKLPALLCGSANELELNIAF